MEDKKFNDFVFYKKIEEAYVKYKPTPLMALGCLEILKSQIIDSIKDNDG